MLGYQSQAGTDQRQAVSVYDQHYNSYGPRGLTITKSAQKWTGNLPFIRALHIIHARCTGRGWNSWYHNNNSRHESK